MSCGCGEVRRYGNGCGGSSISVPSHCVESNGCGWQVYINSTGCGGYSGHARWINSGCGTNGYYEPVSISNC